jgi:polyferredoxin
VIYALFPRRHRAISVLFVISCVLMVLVPLMLGHSFWWGWMLWAVLSVALGLGHPSTIDRDTPLDRRRALAAWATVALFIITFSPVPLSFVEPEAPPLPTQPNTHSQEIIHHAPHYDDLLRQIGHAKI